MDYMKLMYVLEKVKAACRDRHGCYHSSDAGDEFNVLCQLADDGLIRSYYQEQGHVMWKLND
jgi:hypothetical protein